MTANRYVATADYMWLGPSTIEHSNDLENDSICLRTFAEGYPDETSGVVLVNAPSPDGTMGYNGKLVRVRDLAKRTIPPI